MGGVFRHVRDLALQHTQSRHDVGLICDAEGTPGYSEAGLKQLDIHLSLGVHRVPMARSVGVSDIASGRRVLATLKKLKPDIVHGHGAKGGVYARAVGGLAGSRERRVARFYSPHGGSLHFDPASRSGKLYFMVERMLESRTDTLMFVARFEEETYTAKIGAPSCETRLIYNGLAKNEFLDVETAKDAADFLFIGEMRDLKGYDLVIEATKALRANGYERLKILMVGSGPEEADADRLIGDANLDDAITRHGPMPARDAFAKARCVVMPSRAEAMPYIVLEALAAGKPLIASKVGGIPEIFEDNTDALITPNAASLEAAMQTFLDDPDSLARKMPSKAQLRSRFSVEVMAEAALNAYRAALAQDV